MRDGDSLPAAPNGNRRRISQILAALAQDWPKERLTLGDIEAALGDRGFGLLLFVFALPGIVPGVAALASIPLILLALQLTLGLPRPWLPRFLANRSVAHADFARMVVQALPRVKRFERILRPRYLLLTSPVFERIIGLACLLLALLLPLPIPFTNIPVALPIAIMALAVLERDGVCALVGLVTGCLVIGLITTLGWVSIQEVLQWAGKYLGM
jgi:hypothetical protein